MANSDDLESYLVTIAKKYLQEHPNAELSMTKTVKTPIRTCEYCNGETAIFEIPFSDKKVKLNAGKLCISCSCGYKVELQVNYCPMCGRKINNL